MKTLEVIRKMDGLEKRFADLKKEFDQLKKQVNGKEESKKVDTFKSNAKKIKE
jgi:hypothetical protein